MNHIRDKMPDMKARLNTLMGQAQQELNSFGDAAIFGDQNQVPSPLPSQYPKHKANNPPARRPYPPPHDPIRPRLRLLHRRHLPLHLHKGTLRRRADLLHLQRRLRLHPRLHRRHAEPRFPGHSYGDKKLDGSETESVRAGDCV